VVPIEDVVSRPDLADRALFLTLPYLSEAQRRPEQNLWQEFDLARPRLLGALLDAVSHGLRAQPQVRLDRLPRVADFALWPAACETALWPAGRLRARLCGRSQGRHRRRHRCRPGGRLRARSHGRAQLLGRHRR
jgi:hypothetical protein